MWNFFSNIRGRKSIGIVKDAEENVDIRRGSNRRQKGDHIKMHEMGEACSTRGRMRNMYKTLVRRPNRRGEDNTGIGFTELW